MQKLLLLLSVTALLSACSQMNSPTDTSPSPYVQCKTLQRRQLFINTSRPNADQWERQRDSQQLQEAYHNLNCDKIIHDEKVGTKDSTKNGQTTTKKTTKKSDFPIHENVME